MKLTARWRTLPSEICCPVVCVPTFWGNLLSPFWVRNNKWYVTNSEEGCLEKVVSSVAVINSSDLKLCQLKKCGGVICCRWWGVDGFSRGTKCVLKYFWISIFFFFSSQHVFCVRTFMNWGRLFWSSYCKIVKNHYWW